jgi:hypothetical protein
VLTPEVSGTIVIDGASPSAVPVKVCLATSHSCCTGAEAKGVTSASGQFAIAPTTKIRGFMVVMAHKQFHWCIAAQINGKWHTSGPFAQYTLVDTGPAFPERLECNFLGGELSCRQVQRHADGI